MENETTNIPAAHAPTVAATPHDATQASSARRSRDMLVTPMRRLQKVVAPLVGLDDDKALTDDELIELVSRIVRRAGRIPGLSLLMRDLDVKETDAPAAEAAPAAGSNG